MHVGCGEMPDCFHVHYANATLSSEASLGYIGCQSSSWSIQACVPCNQSMAAWNNTYRRQDFHRSVVSEHVRHGTRRRLGSNTKLRFSCHWRCVQLLVSSKRRLSTLWMSCLDRLGMPRDVRATLELLIWELPRHYVLPVDTHVTVMIGRTLSDELENIRCANMDKDASFAERNVMSFGCSWDT